MAERNIVKSELCGEESEVVIWTLCRRRILLRDSLKKARVDWNLEILSEENVSRRLSKRRKGCRKTL
jgi:hypothetical protein